MESAGFTGTAKRVRIYVNEGDLHGHQPINVAVLALLRKEGAAGATVLRAMEGFGASGQVHTARWAELALRLPMVIEWVDSAERVERLLPRITAMVRRGLVTVDDTEVALYCAHPVRDVSTLLRASDVMSREVVSVAPDTQIRKVVEQMLGKTYRAIPVVESGKPVGIITNTDLLKRGGVAMRVELLPVLDTPELHSELERLARGGKTAAEVMTPSPVTVASSTPLIQVAEMMAHRRLKRLPVVDQHGALVGMVGRLDILRSATQTRALPEGRTEGEPREIGLSVTASVSRSMRSDVPTVFPDTPLAEVLQAVIATAQNRCLVVDAQRRVLGKVTDAELLDRVLPALRPSALRALIHRLPFVHPDPEKLETERHAKAQTAAGLMTETAVVREDAPLREAIATMLEGKHKIVAVVDAERHLVGVLDRADLLHGLLAFDGS